MQTQKISAFALIAFLFTLLGGCAANSPVTTEPSPATTNSLSAPAGSSPSSRAFLVPPHASLDYGGYSWSCDSGYIESGIACVPIALPEHASLDYGGHSWSCDSGYTASGIVCVPIALPEHASLDYGGHSWSCDSGYIESGIACVPIALPEHASLDYGGHSWSCDSGYIESGIACVLIALPEHASLDYGGHSWSCESGYHQAGVSCVPENSRQVSSPIAGSPACSETGSCYGDISTVTGLPKTTFVNGYFRSNGTYVGSYYRSR
jgi:hypothetical protein